MRIFPFKESKDIAQNIHLLADWLNETIRLFSLLFAVGALFDSLKHKTLGKTPRSCAVYGGILFIYK